VSGLLLPNYIDHQKNRHNKRPGNEEDSFIDEGDADREEHSAKVDSGGENKGWGESLDISEMDKTLLKSSTEFEAPSVGRPFEEIWLESSDVPMDHIASGSFRTAMDLYSKACGIVNFEPLKAFFVGICLGASGSIQATPIGCNLSIALQSSSTTPVLAIPTYQDLQNRIKNIAFKEMTEGHFAEAQVQFLNILHSSLFVLYQGKKEQQEAQKEIVKLCQEYLLSLKLELTRKQGSPQDNVKRDLELSAYFTHCKLNATHSRLGLFTAMITHFKKENMLTAAGFAKRLKKIIALQDPYQTQVNYVIKMSETKPNDALKLDYDEKNPFVICGMSLVPIYSGSEYVQCPFCTSCFLPKYKGDICSICMIGGIGKQPVSGLQNYRTSASSSSKQWNKE